MIDWITSICLKGYKEWSNWKLFILEKEKPILVQTKAYNQSMKLKTRFLQPTKILIPITYGAYNPSRGTKIKHPHKATFNIYEQLIIIHSFIPFAPGMNKHNLQNRGKHIVERF